VGRTTLISICPEPTSQGFETLLDEGALRDRPVHLDHVHGERGFQVGVPLADGFDILFGELRPAQQPHLAAVADESGHARRRHGEHGAGEVACGAVVADRSGEGRDEEVT